MDTDSKVDSVEQWEELGDFLFDLANTVHEHRDMLFRLSDSAKQQAERLRQGSGGANVAKSV